MPHISTNPRETPVSKTSCAFMSQPEHETIILGEDMDMLDTDGANVASFAAVTLQ